MPFAWHGRSAHVDILLDRHGPDTEHIAPEPEYAKHFLAHECRVLVVGAGGLGCEILVNLALCGFRDIHIIDMDTIDVSNLNRQFLFRDADVGKPKSATAAARVASRVPGVHITPHVAAIQEFDTAFYMQFKIVICGLDSVEARRWMNATLVSMVDEENPESLKPLIDGGSEGLKGQARVILPTITSCYECSLEMLPQRTTYPICTIANTPRVPEHCIEWASVLEWPRVRGDEKLDTDNPDHIQWLLDTAQARADEFSIGNITWSLTQGVVKNIIPAVASTNAIVAAACTQEAFKLATTAAPYLDNYMMYAGTEGVYTYTFDYARRPDCPVCGGESREMCVAATDSLDDVLARLSEMPDMQLRRANIAGPRGPLYFSSPASLEEVTRANRERTLGELGLTHGALLTVTSPRLPFATTIQLNFR